MHNLDSGLETYAVFFDFRKAFDSVPHCKLISKLQSFQLNPALVRWICNYLSGRFQRVVVDGAISQATPQLYQVSHKAQSWVHFCFSCILTAYHTFNFPMEQKWYSMQMMC